MYLKEYENADQSSPMWNAIEAPAGEVFHWNKFSTYIQNPSFFQKYGFRNKSGKEHHWCKSFSKT